jgi:hypothetical protein
MKTLKEIRLEKKLNDYFKDLDFTSEASEQAVVACRVSYDKGYDDGHDSGFWAGVLTVGVITIGVRILKAVFSSNESEETEPAVENHYHINVEKPETVESAA